MLLSYLLIVNKTLLRELRNTLYERNQLIYFNSGLFVNSSYLADLYIRACSIQIYSNLRQLSFFQIVRRTKESLLALSVHQFHARVEVFWCGNSEKRERRAYWSKAIKSDKHLTWTERLSSTQTVQTKGRM
jgi:hypothetical protein